MPKLDWDFDPTLVSVSGTSFRYYSVCFVLALLVGYWSLARQIRRGGGDREEAGDFATYGTIAVLVGARAGHVLFYDLERVKQDPAWAYKIWHGGLASHGAVLGLAIAMYWFTKRRAIPFLEGTDRLAFAAPPAAFLIRLGNLFNSEVVGKPTDGSWGIRFPRYPLGGEAYRHPTQLYEMGLALLVFAILAFADRRFGREGRPRGLLTALLLLTLFSGRFLLEFFKDPQPGEVVRLLNRGQLLSVPLVIAGGVILVRSLREQRAAGWVVGGASTHNGSAAPTS